jgi:hypothetical protein
MHRFNPPEPKLLKEDYEILKRYEQLRFKQLRDSLMPEEQAEYAFLCPQVQRIHDGYKELPLSKPLQKIMERYQSLRTKAINRTLDEKGKSDFSVLGRYLDRVLQGREDSPLSQDIADLGLL